MKELIRVIEDGIKQAWKEVVDLLKGNVEND